MASAVEATHRPSAPDGAASIPSSASALPAGHHRAATHPKTSALVSSRTLLPLEGDGADATDEPLFPNDGRAAHSDTDEEEEDGTMSSISPVHSPVSAPPWWQQAVTPPQQHQRTFSNLSTDSLVPAGGITMRDNERNGQDDGRNSACWAKSVQVTDYVVVNGSATNIGAFVVWNIRVETLTGSHINIRKRYSEFDDLRAQLIQTFPNFEAAVPTLPPKSVIWKFQARFLEKRRRGLQYFLNCILLNPEFSGSPVLKDFLLS